MATLSSRTPYPPYSSNYPEKIQSTPDQPPSELETEIKQVFQKAIESNCIQKIDTLINSQHSFHMIGTELFSKGLHVLLQKNPTEVTKVENILVEFAAKEPRPTFKYCFLCKAFTYALQRGYIKLIENSIRFIHPEDLIDCLEKGSLIEIKGSKISKNFLLVVQIFLHKTSLIALCKFLYALANKNYKEQAQIIINSKCILNPTHYGEGFVQSVQDLQLDIIQLFLKSKRFNTIGSEYLDKALQSPCLSIRKMIIETDRVKNLNIIELQKSRYI